MKRMFKHLMASVLGMTLMLSAIAPAVKAEESTPDFSMWALETLNEGEKYGIFPMEWYYTGFRSEASIERINELLALTEKKIAALELPENKEFKSVSFEEDNTRGAIINRLYNIVARYDLPVGIDPVAYMTERNILKGTGNGLDLEKSVTTQEAVILAIRFVQDTYRLAGQGSNGVAWVVADDDTVVYLLGSIHVGTPDLYPFNEKLVTAFEDSDALLVEANTLDPVGMEYSLEKAAYPEGTTLKDHVSEETFAKLEKVAEQFELPMEQLVGLKPWAVTSSLSTLSLEDSFGMTGVEMATHGIDMYFLLNAVLQGKPVIELEGYEEQIDMFDALSPEAQEQSLVDVLDGLLEPAGNGEADLMKQWFISWKNGDVSTFAKSFIATQGEPSEYSAMLFGKRDEHMAKEITTLLETEEGTFFVVVGAGHFLVDKNIRYHLEQNGYTVEPFYQ